MTDPRLTALAATLPASVPFTGPEALERRAGRPFAARLGANECGFGPSSRAIAAMREAADTAWKYPDPEAHDLRRAIAAHHGCDPAHIGLGEGIDGLLGLIVRLIIAPGDVAVTSRGAYPTFAYHVTGHGGTLATVPYTADHEDPDRLIAETRRKGARLCYISNPDNPMGTWHDAATVHDMVAAVPDHALLLLDEAYVDLAPDGTAADIDPADPRVLRLRTFSKAHGLAGLRVGYAIGPAPIIAALDRVKNHFGVNRIAQAGALAALADREYLHHIRALNDASMGRLVNIARENGLRPIPSATNFVAMDCGGGGARSARILAELGARGVFVRMPGAAPLDRCIRVSTGPDPEVDAFAAALPDALAAAR